ncbi:Hypothetical protein NTJ_09420 [Nesidiocoris tenuis]|uniref:Secreted protein n=1 Tax=Nesidiocoris tenuis TaxID=355587 RepID=A0ABN7B1J8_9HEMI|nr:Hypothetical protein NTJ_09420 [Nesidiocoris tenuis]
MAVFFTPIRRPSVEFFALRLALALLLLRSNLKVVQSRITWSTYSQTELDPPPFFPFPHCSFYLAFAHVCERPYRAPFSLFLF